MFSESSTKTTILPNRYSTVEVSLQKGQKYVKKAYRNVDSKKMFNQYSWLKSIKCPFFPEIYSIEATSARDISVNMELISGATLWDLVTRENGDVIYKKSLSLFANLAQWSIDFFKDKLPLGVSLVHGDAHLGNIIESELNGVKKYYFIDLDSVHIGEAKIMHTELILNLFSHPNCYDDMAFLKKILQDLKIEGLTTLEKWGFADRIDKKYYDYYREFKNFFHLHGILKRELENKICQ